VGRSRGKAYKHMAKLRLSHIIFVILLILLACEVRKKQKTIHSQAISGILVRWDQNTEDDLAGYRVYWGFASRQYDSSLTVYTNHFLKESFRDSAVYYFAVTAFDTANNESGYSDEVWCLTWQDSTAIVVPDTTAPDEPGGVVCDFLN